MRTTLIAISFWLSALGAQAGCLDALIDLQCAPCSFEEALEKIEAQIDCHFSYRNSAYSDQLSISCDYRQVPLKVILQEQTGKQLTAQQRGRYILLLDREPMVNPERTKGEYIIEGVVRNASTGEIIQNATVYTVGNKYSALTDHDGRYRLSIATDKEYIGLSYSKRDYFDTIIVVKPIDASLQQNIALYPRQDYIEPMPVRSLAPIDRREVETLPMVRLLVNEDQRTNAINLDWLEEIPIQFSFIPSLGTNRYSSGVKTNILSLNIISGYNAGLKGFEAGGGVNILRRDAVGFQAAGIGNIVGGEVRGFQASGVFNNVRGSVKGLQAAGVYNIVLDTIRGAQLGGVFNILRGSISGAQLGGAFNIATENMKGLQAAGVFNITRRDVEFVQLGGCFNLGGNVKGTQVAGTFNLAHGDLTGAQVAGALNVVTDSVTGTQVAGAINYAGHVTGNQLSGFANLSGDVHSQTSGFLNVAHTVQGTQIGLFNFCDSSAGSFGLLSISLKGLNYLDVFADEVNALNVSYRTGNAKFYNIIRAGYWSPNGYPLFSAGYGIGSQIGKQAWPLKVHLEAGVRQLIDFESRDQPFNMIVHFDPTLSIRLAKKRPTLVVGPTFNILLRNGLVVTDPAAVPTPASFLTSWSPVYKPMTGDFEVMPWVGARVGLRL